MVRFNNTDRVMNLKVVYVGCALGGKTTSLEKIHERIVTEQRSRLVSLNTANDRTLFFDLLPVDLGQVQGYTVSLQLFTVPGQVQYSTTRRAVLTGADAVVVVVDSSRERIKENRDAIQELTDHLKFHGLDIRALPLVLEYNKRDVPSALSVAELNAELNARDWPHFEAVARDGIGVVEPFLKAAVMMADQVVARYKFPPSFGERLVAALEHLLPAQTSNSTIPEEFTIRPDEMEGEPGSDAAKILDEPMFDLPGEAPPLELSLDSPKDMPSANSLQTVQDNLVRAAPGRGGARQRVQSSLNSNEGGDLESLLQGAIQAHESMARVNADLDKTKDKLRMREGNLADIGRVARWCVSSRLPDGYPEVLKTLIKTLQATGGAILLPDPASGGLKEVSVEGFGSDPINSLPCKGFPSLAAGLYHRACPSVSPDPSGSANPVDRHLQRWNIISHIASPLESQGQLLGLLTAYRVAPSPVFDKADMAVFSAAGTMISVAMELSRLRVRLGMR